MSSNKKLPKTNTAVITLLRCNSIYLYFIKHKSHRAYAQDSLLVVVYSPDLNMFEIFEQMAIREDKEVILTLSSFFQGLKVHCWGSFVNDERRLSASSSYLGELTIE